MDNLTYYTNWSNIGSFLINIFVLVLTVIGFYFTNIRTRELRSPCDHRASTPEVTPDLPPNDLPPSPPIDSPSLKSMRDLLARRRVERWGEIMGDRISDRHLVDNYVAMRRLSLVMTIFGMAVVFEGSGNRPFTSILTMAGIGLIITSIAALWFARARVMRRFFP